MIGAIIGGLGAATGLASQAAGGIMAGKQRKKQRKYLSDAFNDARSDFQRDYYQDPLQDAAIMSLYKRARDLQEENIKGDRQYNTVTGKSDARVSAQKRANAEGMGNAMSRMAAMAQQTKDSAKERYRKSKDAYRRSLLGMSESQAQQWANVASNAANLVGNIGASFMNGLDGTGKTKSSNAKTTDYEVPKPENGGLIDYNGVPQTNVFYG